MSPVSEPWLPDERRKSGEGLFRIMRVMRKTFFAEVWLVPEVLPWKWRVEDRTDEDKVTVAEGREPTEARAKLAAMRSVERHAP